MSVVFEQVFFSLTSFFFVVVLKGLRYFFPYFVLGRFSKLSGQCFCEVHRARKIVVRQTHPLVKILHLQNKLFLRKVE